MKKLRQITPRQREILALKDRGLKRREIAQELGITFQTVGAHIAAANRVLNGYRLEERLRRKK